MTRTIIELKNISKQYEKKVILSNINLKVEKGQFVIIFGESGIGKSTLLNIIALMDNPSFGEYILDGENVNFFNEKQLSRLRNTKIGIVFQMYYLIPKLTVSENIYAPILYRLQSLPKIDITELDRLLRELKLEDKAMRRVDFLSGGEKQRVAIARALITNPEILICDEPTGNLDDANTITIMDALKTASQKGKTIIMVTHNRTLKCYADSVYDLTKDGLKI